MFSWSWTRVDDSMETGPHLKDLCFYSSFLFIFERQGGAFKAGVPVVLPWGRGRDVHPPCLLLRAEIFSRRGRDPRPCVDYRKRRPDEQIPTPATVADSCALRGQHSSPDEALVKAVRRVLTFARVFQSTVVTPPDKYAPGPSFPSVMRQRGQCASCCTHFWEVS